MKVLIAATEPRVAQYAADLLADALPGCSVSAVAGDAAAVALESTGWDVVVWDVGLAAAPAVTMAQLGNVPVVVWGEGTDGPAVTYWLKHGAAQYILRHAGWEGYFAEVVQKAAASSAMSDREPEGAEAWRLTQRSLLASLHSAALVVNPAGLIVQLNRAAERLTGYELGEVTGAGLGLLFEPPTLADAIVSVVASGRSARELRQERGLLDVREDEHTLGVRTFIRRKDGRYVLCDVTFGPVTDPGGEYGGCVVVLQEAVREPDVLTELSGPTGLFAMALAQLPVPVALVDLAGQILHGNPELWRLVGRSIGGTDGTRLQDWLEGPEPATAGLRQIALGRGVPELSVVQVKTAAGPKTRGLSLRPLRDSAGRTIGVVACLTPVESPVGEVTGGLDDSIVCALVQALQLVSEAPDLEALVTASVDALGHLVEHDCAYVMVRDPQDGEKWTAADGVPQAAQEALQDLMAVDLGPEVTVEETKAVIRTPLGVALEPLVAETGIRTVSILPLNVRERRLGFVLAGWRREMSGAESLATVLQAFLAELAGMASHGLLVRAAQRSAAVQARLLEVARALSAGADVEERLQQVAEAGLEIAGGDCCTVELLDEERQQFETGRTACGAGAEGAERHLRAGPLAWQAVQTKEVAFQLASGEVTGSPADDTIAVAVPLLLEGEPIGVISVRLARPGAVSQMALNSLGLLAAQAAVAVNNARLYEISRRRSQHMEVVAAQAWREEARARALFDVAAAVAEKTGLQEILATVTRSACAEIGFERARIYLADQENQVLRAELCCSSNGCVAQAEPEEVQLRRDAGNRLAEAALSSVPYLIDPVEEECGGNVVRYERLLVPLVAQQYLVGLIVADNPLSGAPVSPQQTRLLRSLAGLASVAIERARVERLRGTLISSVSHELRAPLASIRAYNELVLGGDVGPINEDQRMYLQRVDKSCARLERLIADLMNLSKLRAGEVTISKAPTDLGAVVQSVLDTMSPRAREAGVQLEAYEVQKLPVTVTDQGRLEQVLTNLVDNAIKFNEPGGWVRVSLQEQGDEALFAVADNGPGIPKAAQESIFEEFQHGTDVRSRAKEGAGLGLAIARRVIEVLGGRLWLESEPGQGATFYVALPLEPASDDPAPGRTIQPGLPITLGDAHDRTQNTHH